MKLRSADFQIGLGKLTLLSRPKVRRHYRDAAHRLDLRRPDLGKEEVKEW